MKKSPSHSFAILLQAARPKQWVKNSFVLAPLLFSGNIMHPDKVFAACMATLAFCLASSAIYLLNDIIDRENDRLHPLKCKRPIAAGRLSTAIAARTALAFVAGSLLIAFFINAQTAGLTLLYFLSSLAYCYILKKIIFLDVATLAFGFVLRAMAGATAISVFVSPWLIICTFCLAVFLTLCKRRYEFKYLGTAAGQHRQVLTAYSLSSLTWSIWVAAGLTLTAYAAYTVFPIFSPQILHTSRLPLTLPFVFLGLLRYGWMVYHTNKTGTPTEALLTDWRLLLIVIGWGISLFFLLFSF